MQEFEEWLRLHYHGNGEWWAALPQRERDFIQDLYTIESEPQTKTILVLHFTAVRPPYTCQHCKMQFLRVRSAVEHFNQQHKAEYNEPIRRTETDIVDFYWPGQNGTGPSS